MKRPILALIPSAYKSNKIYSALPTDGSGDFEHLNNGSTGTSFRIKKDGTLEALADNTPRLNYNTQDKVWFRNVIQISNFTKYTNWVNQQTTDVREEVVNEKGDLEEVNKVLEDNTLNVHRIYLVPNIYELSTTYILSAKVKPINYGGVRLFGTSWNGNYETLWDLSGEGSVYSSAATQTYIRALDNGWYEIRSTLLKTNASQAVLLFNTTNTGVSSYTGITSKGFYVKEVQLEKASNVEDKTDYQERNLFCPFYYGYTPSGSPHIRAEKSIANLQIHSQDISQHFAEQGTLTANATIAPDGTLTAGSFIEDTTANRHRVRILNASVTTGLKYVTSFYVKPIGDTDRRLWLNMGGLFGKGIGFDLKDKASNGDTQITYEEHPNGWIRVIFGATATVTGSSVWYIQTTQNTFSDEIYQGDGVSGIYIWGLQIEQLTYKDYPYATSLIPTTTVALARNDDRFYNSMVNDNRIKNNRFCIFLDFKPVDWTNNLRFAISDNTVNNKFEINLNSFNLTDSCSLFSAGALSGGVYGTLPNPSDIRYRYLAVYNYADINFEGYIELYRNGVKIGKTNIDINDMVLPTLFTHVHFSQGIVGSLVPYGQIFDFRIYDELLTTEEAIELTTI